jgi:hypothetical protein
MDTLLTEVDLVRWFVFRKLAVLRLRILVHLADYTSIGFLEVLRSLIDVFALVTDSIPTWLEYFKHVMTVTEDKVNMRIVIDDYLFSHRPA